MVDSLLLSLKQGLVTMGLAKHDLPLQTYLAYIALLEQWNTTYNLTAIRQPEKMLSYHILDSLSILPFISQYDQRHEQTHTCLDVATGAGLPGIILALARPDTYWILLDGNNKKTRFVQHAIMTLKIPNAEIMHTRIEDYQPNKKMDTIVTRAFTSLAKFFAFSHRLLAPNGSLLAMKGAKAENEVTELQTTLGTNIDTISTQVIPLKVPNVIGDRKLVKICNSIAPKIY